MCFSGSDSFLRSHLLTREPKQALSALSQRCSVFLTFPFTLGAANTRRKALQTPVYEAKAACAAASCHQTRGRFSASSSPLPRIGELPLDAAAWEPFSLLPCSSLQVPGFAGPCAQSSRRHQASVREMAFSSARLEDASPFPSRCLPAICSESCAVLLLWGIREGCLPLAACVRRGCHQEHHQSILFKQNI